MEPTILWTAQKDEETVKAVLRTLRVGFELRLEFANGQMFGQMFPTLADVEAASAKRRIEYEQRGWVLI